MEQLQTFLPTNHFFSLKVFTEKEEFCQIHNYEFNNKFFGISEDKATWAGCPSCRRQNVIESITATDEKIKLQKLQQNYEKSGIPALFTNSTFENYKAFHDHQLLVIESMINFIKDIDNNLKNGKNLILRGYVGTGKTHLAIALAKRVIENTNYNVNFTTLYQMIDDINSQSVWEKNNIIKKYSKVDLLIIDEITKDLTFNDQKQIFKILNNRYSQQKSTIIITNLMMSEVAEVLGERVIDRLKQNAIDSVLVFDWKSYR